MPPINIAARPYIAPASIAEAAAAQKPAAPVTVPLNAQFVSVDGAVLPAKSPIAQQLEQALSGLNDQQKVQRLMDASHIDAAELEVLADVYVVAKANQQTNEMRASAAETEQQRPSDRLTFDPSSWGDMSVLLAAIAALNLARTVGAELQGKFAQLAYASAVAQGRATIASGRAEMMAAISGAIVSGGLAIGGAAVALKGHKLRHDDAKFNQGQANQLQDKLADAQAGLMKRTPDLSPTARPSASPVRENIDVEAAPVLPVELDDAPVLPDKLDDASVLPAQLDDASVLPAKLDDAPVLPAQLDDAPVLPAKLDDASVLPAQLDDAPVLPAKLDDAPVLPVELDATPVLPVELDVAPVLPVELDVAPVLPAEPEVGAIGNADEAQGKVSDKTSKIDESERAVLGGDIRFTESQIKDLQLKSRLNMRAIDKLLTMSQVMMASSSVMSSMVLASVRTQAYQEQASGIERGAEMSVQKSMHDAEAQTVSEDGAEVNKLLDAMKQLMQQTNEVMSHIGSARA